MKKRIEDFERMKSGLESGKEETNTGRITRHTARNKIAPSSELQASRVSLVVLIKTNLKLYLIWQYIVLQERIEVL